MYIYSIKYYIVVDVLKLGKYNKYVILQYIEIIINKYITVH